MAEKLDGEPAAAAAAAAEPGDNAGRGSDDGAEPTDPPERPRADLPFPGYVATAFYRIHQTNLPRRCCLTMITWPYPSITDFIHSFISPQNVIAKNRTE